MLRIMCPHCQTKLEQATVPPSGVVQCSSCRKQFRVPSAVAGGPKPTAAPEQPRPAAPAPARPPAARPAAPPPQRVERPAAHADARPPRRNRDDDDYDDDEDRPRRRKKQKEQGTGAAVWIVVGSVAGLIIIGGIILALVFLLGDKKDDPKDNVAYVPPMVRPDGTGPAFRPGPAGPPGKGPNPGFRPGSGNPNEQPQTPPVPNKGGTPPSDPATARNEPPATFEQPSEFGRSGAGNESAGSDVYPYLLKSAAFIVALVEVQTEQGPRYMVGSGSGSLIDKKNRLVLTNHHVAGNAKEVVIFFPSYRDGKLLVEKERLITQFKGKEKDLIKGKVVASEMRCDLCILQLDRVPAGIEALPLTKQQAMPGQRVHSIGNPGVSDGLWIYTSGTVRQVYHKKWQARGGSGMTQHDADVVETQSPTNPGDSGGPLVNDRGELVGVTQGGSVGAQLVSFFVDVGEVRKFVESAVESKFGAKWVSDARPPLSIASRGAGGNVTDLVRKLSDKDAGQRAKAAENLGEMGENAKVAIPELLKSLKDEDQLTRRTAASALTKIGLPAKSDVPLLAAALKEPSLEVRQYVVTTLAKMGLDARAAMAALVSALKDEDASIRQAAARALGKLGADAKASAGKDLTALLDDADKDTRSAAAEGLSELLGAADDLPTVQKLMKHKDAEVRSFGVKALAKLGREAKPALPELLDAAKGGNAEARKASMAILSGLAGADAKPHLNIVKDALKEGDKETKQLALSVVVKLGPDAANIGDTVRDVFRDPELKKDAIPALARIGLNSKATMPAIIEAVKDSDESVRDAGLKAVTDLGPLAAAATNDLINLFEKAREIKEQDAASTYLDKIAAPLAKIGKPAVPSLIKALQENNAAVRWGACKALGGMGPVARDAATSLLRLSEVEPNRPIAQEAEKAWRKITAR